MLDKKILVVEDEAIVAEDIASRLERMGYVVTDIVASGENALNSATSTLPDLVLMDIMLQGDIDGITAAKQIYTTLKRPVVYLTAYGDEDTLQRAKFSGSFGYILKPFHERELRAAIEIALTRYQAEMKIQQALELAQTLQQEAQAQNNLKSQYLFMTSHEFRNSLSNITAWTQLLQRYGQTWNIEKQQESLQRIQSVSAQMNELLEDLLVLGRTETQKSRFKPVLLDGINFCEKLLQMQRMTDGDKHILTLNYSQDWRQVYLDATLLGYILNNLISNAIKYSPQGSEISLTLWCQDNEIYLQVTDQGIGIPQTDLPYLFEPFQRASNVGAIAGTGLGLVIAKRAAELHGGQIELQSQQGQGTTIIVKLPNCKGAIA